MTLATIVRRFNLELYETTREDVDAAHDFMVPSPRMVGPLKEANEVRAAF